MVRQIKAAPQKTLSLSRERQDSSDLILLRPDEQQGEGRIGAQLQVNLSAASRPVSGPVELIRYTVSEFVQLIQQTVRGFAGLITNFQSTAGQLSGPVKIVEMGAQLSEQGGGGLALFLPDLHQSRCAECLSGAPAGWMADADAGNRGRRGTPCAGTISVGVCSVRVSAVDGPDSCPHRAWTQASCLPCSS